MRLQVLWPLGRKTNTEKVSTFHAIPIKNQTHQKANNSEITRLKQALPRIQSVGGEVFGSDFIGAVVNVQMGRLEMVFTKGITQRRKNDFASFRGWVELCCME